MSDERNTPAPTVTVQFPPIGFPLIYADDVANLSKAEHVVKFYFSRDDPSIRGTTRAAQRTPVVEIVMPIDGFVRTALFFDSALNTMLAENLISQEEIDAIKNNMRIAD